MRARVCSFVFVDISITEHYKCSVDCRAFEDEESYYAVKYTKKEMMCLPMFDSVQSLDRSGCRGEEGGGT